MDNKTLSTSKDISYIDPKRIESLYQRVSDHVETARQHIQHTIDIDMIKAYWLIGQEIVEEEQFGKERSEYGKAILKGLSTKLQKKYKKGFSVDTLEKARKFYTIFQIDSKISGNFSIS